MLTELSSPSPTASPTIGELIQGVLHARWRILLGALGIGIVCVGVSFAVRPTFTASTTFLPPQQGQSATASALSALGSLASLAGAGQMKSPAEQYIALMQSAQVSDRLIQRHELKQVYEVSLQVDARRELAERVRMSVGKKDGLLVVEVDDESPKRAADVANDYVQELRRMTARLALTETQQRRMFFEQQLGQAKEALARAQQALQASGFDPAALRAEPKTTAEAYARLKAELGAAEGRLDVLTNAFTNSAPEVRQQAALVATLRSRLAGLERSVPAESNADYIDKYREYRYREALFETYAKQFELARVDESREGALIQIIDDATPPERKSRPRRSVVAVLGTMAGLVMMTVWTAIRVRQRWKPNLGATA
ncbi:MAG: hypothetical protein RLZZ182_629 [Pseudomonadota bacterium]|jgi:uncharacterized protein involved in exopolysaccharide biosynthesis